MHLQTYYDTLKVARDAPPEVIAAAYKALAKKAHPDVAGGSAAKMKKINVARDVLLDPAARARYDVFLKEQEKMLRDYPDVFRRARNLALSQGVDEQEMRFRKGAFRIMPASEGGWAEMLIRLEFPYAA